MRIDLHTHSTCSDGTDSPADLVAAAAGADLDVVALTDHDTFAGWDEARDAAARLGIGLVLGAEVSCRLAGTSVHMLAYLPDPTDGPLQEMLERIREGRNGAGTPHRRAPPPTRHRHHRRRGRRAVARGHLAGAAAHRRRDDRGWLRPGPHRSVRPMACRGQTGVRHEICTGADRSGDPDRRRGWRARPRPRPRSGEPRPAHRRRDRTARRDRPGRDRGRPSRSRRGSTTRAARARGRPRSGGDGIQRLPRARQERARPRLLYDRAGRARTPADPGRRRSPNVPGVRSRMRSCPDGSPEEDTSSIDRAVSRCAGWGWALAGWWP